nr:hypothetical protein [Tanacetum cinerariifolium]
MARLAFCDYNNMIAILEKSKHNIDFHQIADFIEASHIRYALTINPTVYVSHIRQFWSTTRIETTNEGTKILAIVDGKPKTISESSIRRHLKLNDEEGISSLSDTELFENLALMGYNILPNQRFNFQKGQFSHQWKCLIHTIMQCLSLKSTGFNEFSCKITTVVVCLAINMVYNFSKMIFDGMVRNVNCKGSNFFIDPRFISKYLKMSQFGQITHSHTYSVPFHTRKFFTTLRVNSLSFSGRTVPLFATMLVTQGEGSAIPTESNHIPSSQEQQSPHHDTSSPSHPTTTSKQIPTARPTEIPTLGQYSRRATRIAQSKAVSPTTDKLASFLRDDSQGEAFPTVSSLDAGHDMETINKTSALPHESTPRMATKIEAQDLEITGLKERIKLLEDKDRGSAEPSGDDAPIKGRSIEIKEEVGVERSTELGSNDTEEMVNVLSSIEDQRMNEQIARDAEKARINAEEELNMLIDGLDMSNEVIAKHLQEYEQSEAELTIGEKIDLINELGGMTLEEIKEKFIPVWKQFEDFIPMSLKEEGKRVKRKGLKLKQGSAKKIKTFEEVSEEDLKGMMQLVPVEEVYVKALQVKHHIIDWEIYSEGKKDYWKIIRLGRHTAVYQFFIDMLKQFDREDLHQLWALVKETLSIRHATKDKEMELWVELKRLFKPDFEDQLWTHNQNLMHDPLD